MSKFNISDGEVETREVKGFPNWPYKGDGKTVQEALYNTCREMFQDMYDEMGIGVEIPEKDSDEFEALENPEDHYLVNKNNK